MRMDEAWIRAHLPAESADQPIDCFSGAYLDGLTVMQEGERGGDDVVVYRATDEEDLRWWQLEQVCRFLKEKDPPPRKTWRYLRERAENGRWLYRERRHYDYNAIEDPRLYGFECVLRNLRFGFPPDRWEAKVREYVSLMNYWYAVPHWDYDREKLCFVEISDSKEHDGPDGVEEPRPGSVLGFWDEEEPAPPESGEKQGESVGQYSRQDLEYAAQFREGVHREALEIIQKTRPDITEVIDRHPVEDYFQEHWDYPGKWYTIVAIPYGYASRKALVDVIVHDTISGNRPQAERKCTQESRDATRPEPGRRRLTNQLDAKPDGYRELFAVDLDQNTRRCRAVGMDAEGRYILEQYEEYSRGGAIGSTGTYDVLTEPEYRRFARLARLNGQLSEEEYERLAAPKAERERRTHPAGGGRPEAPEGEAREVLAALRAEHPECAVDYCIVEGEARYLGYESHRRALKKACGRLFAPDADGDGWQGNPNLAVGKRIGAETLFSSDYPEGKLNYRKAFLYPPHGTGCTGKDFARVNAALFPNGTAGLEVFEWTTDWSDYFDDGHEWWGTLCLTVYDDTLNRFVVIMASATD